MITMITQMIAMIPMITETITQMIAMITHPQMGIYPHLAKMITQMITMITQKITMIAMITMIP